MKENKLDNKPLLVSLVLIGLVIVVIIPILSINIPWYSGISIVLVLTGVLMYYYGNKQKCRESSDVTFGLNDSVYSRVWGSILLILGILSIITIIYPGIPMVILVFIFLVLSGIVMGLIWVYDNWSNS